MKHIIESLASGKLTLRQYRGGQLIYEIGDIPNLILNGLISTRAEAAAFNNFNLRSSAQASSELLNGTWSQSGNTVTRTTGTGVFPVSPSQLGNEIKWQDGERCHVTARASDTSITVSGPPRTITGKTIRVYPTNLTIGSTGANQIVVPSGAFVTDQAAGTREITITGTAGANPTAYTLTHVRIGDESALVVLPVPIAVALLDQIQLSYTYRETYNGRAKRTLTIAEIFTAGGYPVEYSATAIVGNGTTFDVTATAHHFLAGDEVVLRNVIPLRRVITSITASGTAWTVAATGHGLTAGDTVVIAGVSIVAYNGTFTVASVPDANSVTITNATSPGTASNGTIRLATPTTYFNGTFIVASVPNANTVRITSTITGPAVDPSSILTSPDECSIQYYGVIGSLPTNLANAMARHAWDAGNDKDYAPTFVAPTLGPFAHSANGTPTLAAANFANDFTATLTLPLADAWGPGTSSLRVKQIGIRMHALVGGSTGIGYLVTFKTPQPKGTSHRLQFPNIIQRYTRELL